MKTKSIPVLLAAAVLALSGCVQMHSTTTIEADGSGTASMTMSFSQTVAEAMKEMQDSNMDMGQGMEFPSFDDIKKDDLEKAAKEHGVQIKKFSKDMVDGREVMTIELAFKDLKGFSYVMNGVMGEDGGKGGLGIFDAGDGNFVLRSTEYEFPAEAEAPEEPAEEEAPAQQVDPDMAAKQMELMGKLMGAISELDILMEITVPGDIVSSNAPTVEGRKSIWKVNSENMMTVQNEMEPEITFSGKGLSLKPTK